MTSPCLSHLNYQGTVTSRMWSQVVSTVVIFEPRGHYSYSLWLISSEKQTPEDKSHHLTRIKKKNTLAASSQGRKESLSTVIYCHPSLSLTPGHHESCASLPSNAHRLSSLARTQKTGVTPGRKMKSAQPRRCIWGSYKQRSLRCIELCPSCLITRGVNFLSLVLPMCKLINFSPLFVRCA